MMKSLVRTVIKTVKCSDGSEKWYYSDGTSEVKDPIWLAYAKRAEEREEKEWKKMQVKRIHLRTGKSVA